MSTKGVPPKYSQAARKRDFTKFNADYVRLNRDRYIGFDGRYQGPLNSSEAKHFSGKDAAPTPNVHMPNAEPLPLPDNQAVWQELGNARRLDSLFLWLGSVNYKPRKSLHYDFLPREDGQEVCHIKRNPRTPFDELAQIMDPDLFVEGGFQIKKLRRPEREAPAWVFDTEKLRMLVRRLRSDKRGIHKGFTVERAIYVAYLYYRCRLSAREIAGCIGTTQETVEGVIKRVTARANKFFDKLGCSEPPMIVLEDSSDEIMPEIFETWVTELESGEAYVN